MDDSTPSEGDGDGRSRCLVCEEPIEDEAAHRVVTAIEDGQAVHRHFCGEECLSTWRRTDE